MNRDKLKIVFLIPVYLVILGKFSSVLICGLILV